MKKETLEEVLKDISNQVVYIFRQVLASEVGINKKIGKNTLTGDIYSSVRSSLDFPIIYLICNDYIKYIDSGMKKGVYVPIRVLIDWAKKRGIKTDNGTIYAIQRGIYNTGIKGRPVVSTFFKEIDKMYYDEWADRIFNSIWEEL